MSDEEEEQEKEIQKITYGSIISISYCSDNNSFITADGHVSKVVNLLNYTNPGGNKKQDKQKFQNKTNFSNSLFLIYPKSSNTTKQQVLHKLGIDHDCEDSLQHAKPKEPIENEEIVSMQKLLLNEYKYNYDSFQKQNGIPVNYNQSVQLLHLNSCKFLACHPTEAEHEKENFKITLDDYSSEATVFKFTPSFKYQKDGDQVIFANEITLIERFVPLHNKKTYIHSSSELDKLKGQPEQKLQHAPTKTNVEGAPHISLEKANTKQQQQPIDKKFNEEIIKREINASIEEYTPWKLNLFHEYPLEPDAFLRCGDVIWLHHSEANSIITSARLEKGVNKYNFSSLNIQTWLDQSNLQITVEQSITGDEFSDYSGNTFGMWVIQSEVQSHGGFIEYNKKYRLRHLSSGCYLSVQNLALNEIEKEEEQPKLLKMAKQAKAAQVEKPEGGDDEDEIESEPDSQEDEEEEDEQEEREKKKKKNLYDVGIKKAQVVQKQKIKPTNNYQLKLLSEPDESTLFVFDLLDTDKMKAQDPRISNGFFSFIKNVQTQKFLDIAPASGKDLKQTRKLLEYNYVTNLRGRRNDNQLFRLYKANSDEIWEINYVLSSFRQLASFTVALSTLKVKTLHDEKNMNKLNKKIKICQLCVRDLNLFVNNKLGNSEPEQKFGSINRKRQQLLQEQYFIDILVKILEDTLPKEDIIAWTMKQEILGNSQNQMNISEKERKKQGKDGKIDETELMNFLDQKVSLCKLIYRLIISLCNECPKNELLTFDLIPFFQIHAKYIPEAVECISEVCRYNETILHKLTENLKIDFDHVNKQPIIKDQSRTVKFLINLYDGKQYDNDQKIIDNEHLEFRQHEKLTSKPVNLIQYFMNLIWDPKAPNTDTYLSFLSSVCRVHDGGMSLNQENIYKLYNTYNSLRDEPVLAVQHFFREQKLHMRDNSEKELNYVSNLIQFYSQVSFGRNFLWKSELQDHFEERYLYDNIWKDGSEIATTGNLSANFCNLINSLFIDHDPLNKTNYPNFCRLFKQCGETKKVKTIEQIEPRRENLRALVQNLREYLNSKNIFFTKQITRFTPEKSVNSSSNPQKNEADKVLKAEDLLNDPFLMNSVELYYILLQLNVYYQIGDPTRDYAQVLQYLLNFLQYSKNNMKFVASLFDTDQKAQRERLKKNEQKIPAVSVTGMFSGVTNFMSKQIGLQEAQEEDGQEINLSADIPIQQLYTNPIMRGFTSLNNSLEDVHFEDYHKIQNELNIKVKICEIIGHLLDRRQDFLLQNALNWFQKEIIECDNKDSDLKFVEDKLEDHIKGIMPNIGKTGIDEVDEEFKPGADTGGGIKIGFNMAALLQREVLKEFKKFNKDIKGLDQIDHLLSKSVESNSEKEEKNPSAAVLPKLLSAYLLVTDDNLQKILLKMILRLFNQRLEFRDNMFKMLVIFDQDKTDLYEYITKQIAKLKTLIEKSEIWLAKVVNSSKEIEEIDEIIIILKNLKNSFYKDIYIYNDNVCMQENNMLEIDMDKQQILRYLNCSETIMALIKDGVPHLQNYLMDASIATNVKEDLIIMFTLAHQTLREFVKGNKDNQQLMVGEVDNILRYAKIDVGQIPLVCEIFRNNYKLLEKFDQSLLERFVQLIENEGRQSHFLQFFEVIQSIYTYSEEKGETKTDFIFENQLIVLNTLLPMKNIGERQIKLLYADGTVDSDGDIKLYFEDTSNLKEMNFLEKLREVDFRDTYRDEPFLYHARLLNLILKTTLDQCQEYDDKLDFLEATKIGFNISINKAKKSFPMHYLMGLLANKDDYFRQPNGLSKREWLETIAQEDLDIEQRDLQKEQDAYKMGGFSYLKPHILNFLRCVHILSDKELIGETQIEISNEQREFGYFITVETKRLYHIQNNQQYTQDYCEYLFDYLLPTITAYIEKYFPPKKGKQYKFNLDDIRKDFEAIVKFSDTLHKQYDKFAQRIDARQEIRVQSFLANFYQYTEELVVEKRVDQEVVEVTKEKVGGQLKVQKIEKNKDINIGQFQKINKALGKVNIVTKFQIKEIQQKTIQEQKQKKKGGGLKVRDFDVQLAWEIVQDRLYYPFVMKEIDLERSALAQAFLNIKQLCSSDYMSKIEPKPSLELILQKLIDFLKTSIEDPSNKSTNIALIQVMIKIIQQEEKEQYKIERQNLFQKLGAIDMVLYVISENHKNFDGDLFENFLLFINCLLEGGNSKNQQAVYTYFTTNRKSEIIFKKFQGYFDKQIQSLQLKAKKERLKQAKKGKKAEDIEEEDPEEEEEDIFCSDQDVEILAKILDFLQNCVEGHYLELQNYFRFQHNNRNKYDMINAVADLLKTYYYDARTQDMYENMLKCLDTLSEFIQGPCADNQIAVAESKFFEICQDIFQPIEEKEEKKVSGTMKTKKSTAAMKTKKSTLGKKPKPISLNQWHIARLQNKCLILVLSLLEKRDVTIDSSIVRQIMRHLPVDIIEYHLIQLYEKFQKQYRCQYRLEVLQHLQLDPEELLNQVVEEEEDEDKKPSCFQRLKQWIYKLLIGSCLLVMKVLGIYEETISLEDRLGFIMQNGFFLFFLFYSYMESGERVEGALVNEYKLKQKTVVSSKKSFLQQILDADNIISQLLKFVYTIVMQILEIIWEFQKQTREMMMKKPELSSKEKKELVKRKMKERQRILKNTFNFFFDNSAHIDVVREDELEQIFFIKLPYTQFLPKERKTKFNDEVDRTNLKAKVEGLVEASKDLIEVCKHEERLNNYFQKYKFLALFANYVKLWKDLAFILTLVLNLFILLSYSVVYGDRLGTPILFMSDSHDKQSTQLWFFVIGLIMTVCSLFVVAFFLIKNLPLVIKKIWKDDVLENDGKKQGLSKRFVECILKIIKILIQILQEIEVMYYISYGILAVLGTFYHPFFFVFHLTEILMRYPTLKSVIRSVYIPRDQLGLTFILFIIVIYVFTIIGHNFFREYYEKECENLFYCFMFMIDTTFKSNAGIGGWMSDTEEEADGSKHHFNTRRFFFDTFFNIIIVIILVNIVSGIIIDKFGQLRESENKKLKDIEDKCFICANKKTDFDRQSQGGFKQHIKISHYMWNYMFYIAYLKWKDPQEFTGVESYVFDKLENSDSTWFPLNKARELLNLDDQLKKDEKEAIFKLKGSVDHLVKGAKNINKKFGTITKN